MIAYTISIHMKNSIVGISWKTLKAGWQHCCGHDHTAFARSNTEAAAIIEEDDERLLVSDLLIDTPEGDLKDISRDRRALSALPSVVIIP